MSDGRPAGSGADARRVHAMRRAAVVIVAAMVLWMAGNWLGGRLNWPLAVAFALDIACLAALVWAAFEALALRRAPRD